MGCIITIKVKGETYKYETSLSPEEITLENIAKEIAENKITYSRGKVQGLTNLGEALANSLKKDKELASNTRGIKRIIKDFLQGDSGTLVGNYTLDDLAGRFSRIDFGGLTLKESEQILFTQNLSYEGIGLGGKVTMGDTDVFIISNEYDARKLANYLKLRGKLESENIDFDNLLDPKEKRALEYIKSTENIAKTKTALLKFFNNSDKYLTAVIDDIDVYTTLSNFLKEKIDDKYVRQTLDNPVANSIMQRARYIGGDYYLSKEQLSSILKMFNVEELPDFEKDAEIKNWLEAYMSDAKIPIRISITKHGFIKLHKPYTTFSTDFSYEDIALAKKLFEKETFKVFQIKNKYYVSQDTILTLDSFAQSFDSINEARNYVINRVNRTSIVAGYNRGKFGLDFSIKGLQKYSTTIPFNPSENTVFSALNYNIPIENKLSELIVPALIDKLGNTLEEFRTFLGNTFNLETDIVNLIDSYDRAMVALIELSKIKALSKLQNFNNFNLTTTLQNAVKDTIQKVGNIEEKRFLVINSSKFSDTRKLLLQMLPEDTEEQVDTYRPPILVPLTNLADTINAKYRKSTKSEDDLVYIITNSDIDEGNYGLNEFRDVDKSASGFIYNGKIYINASYAHYDDLFHEYGHLLLGFMKAQEGGLETYTKLMHKVANVDKVIALKESKRQQSAYANLADEDLTEEAFVDLLGEYLKRNNKDLGFTKDAGKLLNGALQDFGTFLDGAVTLGDIFNNFSTMSKDFLFQGNGLEFEEAAVRYRKATNFIANELGKKSGQKIEMTC